MKFRKLLVAAAAISAAAWSGTAPGAEPVCLFPLDGTGDAVVRADAKAANGVVYGRGAWVEGVSGQGLDVRRHAYDQVTCFGVKSIEGVSPRSGTLAFWFKPHWKEAAPETHWIFNASPKDWKTPFRLYMVKTKQGAVDLSVVAPRQLQICAKNVFRQETWTHLAITWDAAKGEVALYADGRRVGKNANPQAFAIDAKSVAIGLALGEGSTDRFKANVGDGVYDDVRVYDAALTPNELMLLASGAEASKMNAVAFAGTSFAFSCREARSPSAKPLVRLLAGKGKAASPRLTLLTLGASGRLGLAVSAGGKSVVVESADTFRLTSPVDSELSVADGALVWTLDGAEQGRVPFADGLAAFDAAECADGVALLPAGASRQSPALARLAELKPRKGEDALWSLDDAQRRADGVRRGVTLNGHWRVQPVNDFTVAPPADDWRYVRVPGSFRSPVWRLNELKDGKVVAPADAWGYGGVDRTQYRAAWYQRGFATPEAAGAGARAWLDFENLNGDAGRVYLNGRMIHSFRQDGRKMFTVVPNQTRLDVTELLKPAGETNVLTVYVDRHYVGLWMGHLSIGDHSEIALGDVWLETAPGRVALKTGVALPSFRRKELTLRARIDNPARQKGTVGVRYDFARGGRVEKSVTREVALDGAAEQRVTWTEKWADPVLWNVEEPNVYEMRVALVQDGRDVDSLPTRPFGFREAWAADGAIWLNGVNTRLRMWTCPGLNRLRYYYGDPEAVGQYVAHVKAMNYDTVRFDPLGKQTQVGWTEYLTACDRQGLYNLFPMIPYEDEPANPYLADVERFLEWYGNHPSIIMWYTDFNTCSYPWNQDPAKLGDAAYCPPWKPLARARVRTAERVMRALDPSREVFQHAGGSSGRIFTSMNYQSYGTPLQEQEDWPAQWAAKHEQPLMVVESGFPYPPQLVHFDKPALGSLVPEHAARYFGDAVYGRETDPVPYYDEWRQRPERPFNANQRALTSAHYARVVKAWRAYGMNALGDFPGGRDLALTARTFDHQNVVWSRSDDVKTAGLKPDAPEGGSEAQRHLLTDYSLPDYLDETVRGVFAPLLVYLGGDPADFTNKDHAFYAGERFAKSVVVVNDHVAPRTLTCRWQLRGEGGALVDSGEAEVTVAAGGIVRHPIALAAPQVWKKTAGRLALQALCDGRLVCDDAMDVQFWPKASAAAWRDVDCALFDPAGRTAPVLKAAGFPFRVVTKPEELGASRLLVVGSLALDGTNALLRAVEESGAIDRGLKVLVFEQRAGTLPGFEMVAPSARDAFARRPESPYLKGLSDADLHDWRGASDVMPAFVVSDERSPHYPRSKWKCGNGGMVSGYAIKKPSRGNFRTVVDCGFNLGYASLLEYRRRHGLVVFCQMDVTSRYGKDPAATRLVDNLLESLGGRFVPVGAVRARYAGDAAGAATLDALGVSYRKLPTDSLCRNFDAQVLIVGANPVPQEHREALKKAMARVPVVLLPGAPLDLLPFGGVAVATQLVYRASAPKGEPVFAGIPDADLYFRTPHALPVYAGAPDWFAAATPAIMGRLGSCILMPPAPAGVDGLWNGEKLARVWSSILTELNVGLAEDSRLFVPGKVAPYAVKPDPYDGDAFHNW